MADSGTQPLRLVLDTNVVVAGLLWSGPPRRLLEAAVQGEIELFSSAVLLDELAHTLGYATFTRASKPSEARSRRWWRNTRPS